MVDTQGWVGTGPVEKAEKSLFRRNAVCGCGKEKYIICSEDGVPHNKRCQSCSGKANRTHGQKCGGKVSTLYRIWHGIKVRCFDVNSVPYKDYGGRGITMSSEWRADFQVFADYVGERPEGKELDRINNDGNYEPGNVRWATKTENGNNKRSNRKLTHDGETLGISEWARRLECSTSAIRNRIEKAGMSVSDALTFPFDNIVTTRRRNHSYPSLTHDGQTLTYCQWAEKLGISPRTITARVEHGWDAARALSPPRKYTPRKPTT